MKIVVIGIGHTGELFIRMLCKKQNDLVVLDKKQEVVDRITDRYSVSGVCGNSTARETLQRAGVGSADVVVALTDNDAANLL